jgi:multicomponent Na+:H+ antiporter subunit B
MLIAAGLLTGLVSGVAGLLAGRPFMTGLWFDAKLPVFGKVGTPLLFDAGVYLVVVGVVTLIVFSFMEE